jgi:uncharacterized protein
MSEIIISKLTEEEIQDRKIRSWPIWTKEISNFEWYYENEESCLILEGDIWIDTEEVLYHLFPGDFVVFPKGLKCKWIVKAPVRKHYQFS